MANVGTHRVGDGTGLVFSASLRVYLDQLLKKYISAHNVGIDIPLSQHHRCQLDSITTPRHRILCTGSKSWVSHGSKSFPGHCGKCPPFLNHGFCLMVLLYILMGLLTNAHLWVQDEGLGCVTPLAALPTLSRVWLSTLRQPQVQWHYKIRLGWNQAHWKHILTFTNCLNWWSDISKLGLDWVVTNEFWRE